MQLVSVTSSNIAQVGWEPSPEDPGIGTLRIAFHSGHIDDYEQVPESEYEALLGARSKGRYVSSRIIPAYEASRIR